MRLTDLAIRMRCYNYRVSPGKHSDAWKDFLQEIAENFGVAPWDDEAHAIDAGALTDYWVDVANNASDDYDDRGKRITV